MTDHVVDTNVLLVASAGDPASRFADSHVPFEQRRVVLDWLAAFRDDDGRRLVLDDQFAIFREYRRKLTDHDDMACVSSSTSGRRPGSCR